MDSKCVHVVRKFLNFYNLMPMDCHVNHKDVLWLQLFLFFQHDQQPEINKNRFYFILFYFIKIEMYFFFLFQCSIVAIPIK